MSTPTEDDLDTLEEGELLALPGGSIPPGRLTEFFTRRAELLHQKGLDQLMFELSGNSTRRFMIFGEQDPKRREAEDRRRASLAYEESMRQIRERSDRLLAQIEIQQQEIDKQRREIEDRAIKLRDGRRVYVDGDRYRDEHGRLLEGADADEARERHGENPGASTWDERRRIQELDDELERLRQKVLREQQEAERSGQGLSTEEMDRRRKEAEQRMTGYEQELNAQRQTARAELAAKPDLVAAYAADSLGDYAGPAGGKGKTAAPDFKLAVAGLTETESTQKAIPPSGPSPPKAQA
jgi:hypothetical protein